MFLHWTWAPARELRGDETVDLHNIVLPVYANLLSHNFQRIATRKCQ